MAGLPTYTRANSLSQFYFVNGRSVRDKVLVGAVRAAFADYVPHLEETQSMADAVRRAAALAAPGDVVLLSPCCASFDLF